MPLLAAHNAARGQRIGSPVAAGVVLFAVAYAVALLVLSVSGGTGALARVPGQPPVLFLGGCLVARPVSGVRLIGLAVLAVGIMFSQRG